MPLLYVARLFPVLYIRTHQNKSVKLVNEKVAQYIVMAVLMHLWDPEKLLPVMYFISGGHEPMMSF